MKFFNDISNFNNVSDYLPILNGILFVETFVIFSLCTTLFVQKLSLFGIKNSNYQQFYAMFLLYF